MSRESVWILAVCTTNRTGDVNGGGQSQPPVAGGAHHTHRVVIHIADGGCSATSTLHVVDLRMR